MFRFPLRVFLPPLPAPEERHQIIFYLVWKSFIEYNENNAIKKEKTSWKFEYNFSSGKPCKYDLMSFLAQHNAAYWEHDKI